MRKTKNKLDDLMDAGLSLLSSFYQRSTPLNKEEVDQEAYRFINHTRQRYGMPFGWDKSWIDYYDKLKNPSDVANSCYPVWQAQLEKKRR